MFNINLKKIMPGNCEANIFILCKKVILTRIHLSYGFGYGNQAFSINQVRDVQCLFIAFFCSTILILTFSYVLPKAPLVL